MIAELVLAAAITAHAPSHVPVDGRIPVSGRVHAAQGTAADRVVRLEERTADGWATTVTSRCRPTGRFTFDVSAGHALITRVLRVVAPRDGRARALRSPAMRVQVDLPGRS